MVSDEAAFQNAWRVLRLFYEHGRDIRVTGPHTGDIELDGNPSFGPVDAALSAWARTAEMTELRRFQATDFIECPLFFGGEEKSAFLRHEEHRGWRHVERRLERWPAAATHIQLFHDCNPLCREGRIGYGDGVSVQRFVFPLLGEQWLRLWYAELSWRGVVYQWSELPRRTSTWHGPSPGRSSPSQCRSNYAVCED